LAVYQWYNANRGLAEGHAAEAMSVLDVDSDDAEQLVQLGHAFAMQAYLAVQASDLDRAKALIAHAREIAAKTRDSDLMIRVRSTKRGNSHAGSGNRYACCPSRPRSSSSLGRQANPTTG